MPVIHAATLVLIRGRTSMVFPMRSVSLKCLKSPPLSISPTSMDRSGINSTPNLTTETPTPDCTKDGYRVVDDCRSNRLFACTTSQKLLPECHIYLILIRSAPPLWRRNGWRV